MTRYLIGFPSTDVALNQANTHGGIWTALEQVVGPRYRSKFMYAEKVNVDGVVVHRYKHKLTEEYINADDQGRLYQNAGGHYRLISIEDAQRLLVPNLLQALADGRL